MSRRDEDENELSESQRLSILEETVTTNRRLLIAVLMMALIVVSVTVTMAVVRLLAPDVTYVDTRTFARVEQEVTVLKEAAIAWEQKAADMKVILDSSHATAFKAMMLEQEQSYQLHLNALKEGMRDLARMVPGSRTWLEEYEEQMNTAIEQSKARMTQLSRLQTSELPQIEALQLPERAAPAQVIN